jgi:hypothetical protein
MGKDFLKFMVLVVVIYLGFLTTFSLVGRDSYSLYDMTGFLTRIFFGSSYLGLDIMHNIDPIFGPPLMILFVMLSSILLTGSLTGMLSNSFSRVITHAREEYLYVYSVYVLEASTSNRLTHFYPPFNLLALVIFRPLRLFLPSDNKFRKARILLLKATHLPIVAVIEFYEWLRGRAGKGGTQYTGFRGPRHATIGSPNPAAKHHHRLQQQHQQSSSSLRADLAAAVNLRPPPALTAGSTSASSSTAVSRGTGPIGPGDSARLTPRQQQAATEAAEEEAFGEPSTDVEVRIADLAAKIDRLTELVVALQAQQSRGLTDVSVA